MKLTWEETFSLVNNYKWKDIYTLSRPSYFSTLNDLIKYLDIVHIKFCLIKPFFENKESYPLVNPQELLPSFEPALEEYPFLPGFSLVVLDRPIDYFNEVFQFDLLHCIEDAVTEISGPAAPYEPAIVQHNLSLFLSRLPRKFHDSLKKDPISKFITNILTYPKLIPYLLNMDRAHVIAKNTHGKFYFAGVYASFPSDLDTELKRFGLKIGKFQPGDNRLYEINRLFVYQFLMELYGFPIASERRTSSALFARKLFKMGEDFLIRVLGQSDRTITSLYRSKDSKLYPKVEKIALVRLNKKQKDKIKQLKKLGLLVSEDPPCVILKVHYKQHKYDPNNVRTDRALSVVKQEIIHPITGEINNEFNIIKDINLMTYVLNDIVKGEYTGKIKYKRNEIVENTETHEKRLKFLYAWLNKHRRRIIGYSDEFYHNITKVLDNYLLNSENYEIFQKHMDIFQEVWKEYSYIQQARKVKLMEELTKRIYKGKKISYLEALTKIKEIAQDFKFESVMFFENLLEHVIYLCESVLNDKYLIKKYISKNEDELTEYGKEIKRLYGQLVLIVDDLKKILRQKKKTNIKLHAFEYST